MLNDAQRAIVKSTVPLLETGGESRCDAVLVVTAPAEVQRQRASGGERRADLLQELRRIERRRRADRLRDRRAHFPALPIVRPPSAG